MLRFLAAASFAFLAACGGKTPSYDAMLAENEGAGFVGAGLGGDVESLLLCDPTGASDWPPLTVFVVLPEVGENFETDKRFATVDGRKVQLSLTLKIDGRAFKVSDYWVQQHEALKRAIIAGGVADGEAVAKALETAKSVEFAGDGRRFRINIGAADSRKSFADICRSAAGIDRTQSEKAGSAPKVETRLSNNEIETAIVNHWRNGNAAFEKNGLRYRITEAVKTPGDLPADAQARGLKAYPGIGFETETKPFSSVLVAYAVFDDPSAADAYFSDAAYNLGDQEVAEIKSFRIERPGYPVVAMNCVYVPSTDNSVNCHFKTPDRKVVALLLFASGPALDFSGDERAIDLVFADDEAADRVSLVASASWAYLYDAAYR